MIRKIDKWWMLKDTQNLSKDAYLPSPKWRNSQILKHIKKTHSYEANIYTIPIFISQVFF